MTAALRALTSLGEVGRLVQNEAKGRLDEMPLDRIERDPENPRLPLEQRTPEEQQSQSELNDSVKARGVKSPISLRPHPLIPDRWMINHGHCRYEAALAAGLATIPYFIDQDFNSFDQLSENVTRTDLSPWSLAEFFQRRIAEGYSQTEIAQRISKSKQYVSDYLALADAPACLHTAYERGIRSPRTLYDLRRAYTEFPEQITAWAGTAETITRDTIKTALARLREPPAGPAPVVRHDGQDAVQTQVANDVRHDGLSATNPPVTPDVRHDGPVSAPPSPPTKALGDGQVKDSAPPRAPLASAKPPARTREIIVQYKGKPARIAASTTVRISMDGLDAEIEVPLAELVFKP